MICYDQEKSIDMVINVLYFGSSMSYRGEAIIQTEQTINLIQRKIDSRARN